MNHDVIVVGGGTAGCILAARLSEEPGRSVLLLEAGPDFGADGGSYPPELRDELVYPWDHMWDYEGLPTEFEDRRIVAFRGRAIGGSSAVNGSLYVHGSPEDYDSWGSPLWTGEALSPAFARIERDLDSPDRDGAAGPLPLRRAPRETWPASQQAFHGAAAGLGHSEVGDLLPNDRDGVGAIPRNSVDGVRVSTAMAYLEPARGRPNLTVRGEAMATRVLVEDGAAVGVEVLSGGQRSAVHGREVVLAAGAIGSPHLLTLSGIGPAEVLQRLGIPAISEREGVGRNLSDHGLLSVIARLRDGVDPGEPRSLVALRATGAGSSTPGDIFLTATSGELVDNTGDSDRGDAAACYMSIYGLLNLPESRGELEIVSADAADLPRVHYRYLDSSRDRERFREIARLAVAMLEAPELAELVAERVAPTPAQIESEAELDAWIETTIATAFHGSGTCKMGAAEDPTAVVDEHGRVIGVERLRVADLSIAPTVVRAPTNATAMAIAERVAELLGEQRPG